MWAVSFMPEKNSGQEYIAKVFLRRLLIGIMLVFKRYFFTRIVSTIKRY